MKQDERWSVPWVVVISNPNWNIKYTSFVFLAEFSELQVMEKKNIRNAKLLLKAEVKLGNTGGHQCDQYARPMSERSVRFSRTYLILRRSQM